MLNKLYEDNALGTIPQDRYEQMSQKYSEEYYALKAELAELQEQLSAFENAGGRAQKFLKDVYKRQEQSHPDPYPHTAGVLR